MRKVTNKELTAYKDAVKKSKSLNEEQQNFLKGLSDEQRRIVISSPKYCLVRSAAGSGKTTVLVAKYLYLTRILNVAPEKIVYLSYNKRNVSDTAKKLKELKVPSDEIEKVARTFHALALKIIEKKEQVWPELLEPVSISWDETETDHDKAEVFLSKYRDMLKNEIEKNPKLIKAITQATVRSKGNKPHKYVSYYLDKNGIPGSCRSKQEKEIFDLLAQYSVDFAYEEADIVNNRRPDFTIYTRDGQRVIYEHFTAENQGELETISKTDGDRYLKAERKKITQYPIDYGKDNCIFTYGANKSIEEIWELLKKEFDAKNIYYDESQKREPDFTTDKILENVVTKFKEVRNQIVETGNDVMKVACSLSHERGYVSYFKIFKCIEKIYDQLISDNSGYTDFADSIVKATKYCNEDKNKLEDFSFDYVLVDEFQDISSSRHALLKALKAVNPKLKLLAVGDDWQSIYSFSCSDLRYFYQFKDNWGKQSAVEVDMSETFRFGDPVLKASTSFIKKDTLLSSHEVISATDTQTELIIKSFDGVKTFKERKKLQWEYIKKEMSAEMETNPNTEFLILSRYNNVAKDFQDKLQECNLLSGAGKKHEISLTIHRAKGLTADVVFIQECQNNSIPLVKQDKALSKYDQLLALIRKEPKGKKGYEKKLQEERRLFYVALTRAKKKVYILYDKDLKSDFINEIEQFGRKV